MKQNRKANRMFWPVVLASFLSCLTARAQTTSAPGSKPSTKAVAKTELESIDLLTMEIPTIITASRYEQKITSVPYAVSIITADDIRAAGSRNVPDAMRLATGVNVADLSYNTAAVNVRGPAGMLSRDLLVLVDGRPIFDALFGGTPWGVWPFQMEDIARIEVIRGPAGVTWGANAVNGVVNIITKDPKDQLGLTVTGSGGSRGTNKEHVGYAFQDKKLRMRVSGEYEGSDGFDHGGVLLGGLDDFYKTGRLDVHAIYDAGPSDKLTFLGGSQILRGGIPPSPMNSLFKSRTPDGETAYFLTRWDHSIAPDNNFNLSFHVNESYECPGGDALEYRYEQYALQFGHTFKPADNHTFTWGIDTRADYLDAHYADPHMLSESYLGNGVLGIYAQDEWRFAPKWQLNLGARIDYDFYGGFQPSGRAALSYDLTETSLIYGSVSRAFQMPPVGSRFLDVPMLDGLAYATADREIQSIQLVAYELGYRGRFLDKLDTSMAVFCHSYDDMTVMRTRPGPPGLMTNRFMNAYDAYVYGVEMDAKYALSKQLTLMGNYTFETMDTRGLGDYTENDIMSLPKHKFMIGALYTPIERLRLSSQLYYVDDVNAPNPNFPLPFMRKHIDSYFRLDLRAEYEFWKDTGWIAVGVRNLLDPDHPEGVSSFQNYAEVPRMVYAELRMTFK